MKLVPTTEKLQLGQVLKVKENIINYYTSKYRMDRKLVEDFSSDAVLKLYESRPRDFNLEGWLYKTTHNYIKDYFKWCSNKYNISYTQEENSAFNGELREVILSALDGMDKDVFVYYFDGFKLKEISEILGISLSKVKNILGRKNKEKLKNVLHSKGFEI